MRLSRLAVVAVACGLVLLHSASHGAAWGEDNLSSNPELSNQEGINDTLGTASEDLRLDSFPNSGTGVISNDNDDDWYKLTGLSSGSDEFLKVTTDGSRIYIRLRDGSFNYYGQGSLGKPLYFKLPSSATDYYLEVNRGGDSNYRITMEKVGSGTITGQLQVVGLVNSSSNSMTVYAYDQAGQEIAGMWVSDPSGGYSLPVPENVSVYVLGAKRTEYHYSGIPPLPSDWLYGLSYHLLSAPIMLTSGGSSINNHFKVYPSTVITGTISPSVNVTLDISDVYTGDSGL